MIERERHFEASRDYFWALEWLAEPDHQRSASPSTPLAQPLHHRPTSASIRNARSGTASRGVCVITVWALDWVTGPDSQRSTAPTTALAQPLHHRPTSAASVPSGTALGRSRLGRSSGQLDQTISDPRHPTRRSRNHYISDPRRRRSAVPARERRLAFA